VHNQPAQSGAIAVLLSGGLDSAILVADLCSQFQRVFPIYIRSGLAWESAELAYVRRYLQLLARPAIQPLTVLQMPAADLYGEHWSMTGRGVPPGDTPDEAVFLPGRNLLLLVKALLWCHRERVPALALGVLKANPFPDATDQFFQDLATVVNLAVEGQVRIERPYAALHKREVLWRGRGLPLEWSFSCIQPVAGRHCGTCNKCAERRRAFVEAGWPDPTVYASSDGLGRTTTT
jgi:7-cyano-7-deazaguanine synthase